MYQLYRSLSDEDLAELYKYPAGPVLRANMVASVDGAASLGGASAGLSSAADRHVFALLRTLADVILVGANTARVEGYKPVRVRELWRHLRSGRSATPPIAVVSSGAGLDLSSPLFAAAPAHARTIIVTTGPAAAKLDYDNVIVAGSDSVDLSAAVTALHERGHQHILSEGGPGILGQLVAGGLLDELCLTTDPLLAGPGAPRIVTGSPMPTATPLRLAHILDDNGFLLCRYLS
jgi:riboflavin biosynthesis pyrimidine reductase